MMTGSGHFQVVVLVTDSLGRTGLGTATMDIAPSSSAALNGILGIVAVFIILGIAGSVVYWYFFLRIVRNTDEIRANTGEMAELMREENQSRDPDRPREPS